ncbi:hypothetical protein JD844_002955 [Phrynosoma platyrhinos]|uniref:Uncharacterized protein n=1 Tax=Phrynosoma platyrhinos TaxID=52577 RepID=A0ABQ7TCC2_PHRPL|nr:hypothetical protein JD844_002955 [Phrynosoma platyrhinos]
MCRKTTVLLALLSLSSMLELGSTHKRWSMFRSIFKIIKYKEASGGDPGQPLFLTPYIESGRAEEGRHLSLVGPLPGANVKSYSGYLTVNKTHNSNLFFWFFPAQDISDYTVSERKFPWTSKFSMLYIDNPVGTGFSFTDDEKGYAENQDDVGRDLYSALIQFFQLFPDYQKNDFYATGESYAGKYVPAIGYYIHTHNPTAKIKINFKGVAIGDGLCDPELMLGGYAEFLYQIGLVDEKQRDYIQNQTDLGVIYIQQKKWREAFEVCIRDPHVGLQQLKPSEHRSKQNGDKKFGMGSSIHLYSSRRGKRRRVNGEKQSEPEDQEYFGEFLALTEVRKSIHVGNLTFHDGSEVEKHLLEDVLLYSGQLDVIVAAPLTERFLPTVPWAKVKEYKNAERTVWKICSKDPEVAGYVRQAGDFYQVIVRGGGHILPYDQPERTLDMMDRFISGKGWKYNGY